MDRWFRSIKDDSTYDAHHYQYAWNRFLAMIEKLKLKISNNEKENVKNYLFQDVKIQDVSMFQELADKCLEEAKKYFDRKK